jgi:hypothetical protein
MAAKARTLTPKREQSSVRYMSIPF